MRTISPEGLAKLAQTHGNEPIILLEVDWREGSTPCWYADRDVEEISGRILTVGGMDNVVGVSSNNTSQSLEIVLDDTDGSIKTIMDGADVHKRTARVYQWFQGLDLDDKFLLFAGKLSSPITWDERERTVSFTIISQLEDKEVGFTPEEGDFDWLPAGMVGKTWPLIFGTVMDCPALQINEAVTGTTLSGVGVIEGWMLQSSMPLFSNGTNADSSVAVSLALILAQISTLWCAKYCWNLDSRKQSEILDQINGLEHQRGEIIFSALQQAACASWQRSKQLADATAHGLGPNPIQVLGGEDFPQNTVLTIEINGALFVGYFSGTNFHITSRSWPEGLEEAQKQKEDRDETCSGGDGERCQEYDYRYDVPCHCGNDFFRDCLCHFNGWICQTQGRASRISDDPVVQQFWAEPGATVRIYSDEPITYFVSIVPGTVLAVRAYKQFTGERRLVDVPASYYTVQTVWYGTLQVVQIVCHKPLSSYKDQGYTDDLYVTFQSSVGPHIIDILIYLINTYTDLTYDVTSFTAVRTKLNPFPANFPVLERKNAVGVLQDIAYQARCALWISNGVFYIKYLPEEPTAVATITESDIDAEKGITTELTTTEDIVTKMKIKWRMSWSPGQTDREKDKSEKYIILRHNVNRYGIQEEEKDFYIYNQPDSIYKCATFWLIRKSNTWKRIKFSTFLHKLNLETFDCVTLNFSHPYVATGSVKALVEKASYNSDTNQIDFECLVPIKAGQMTKYNWFWPAGLPISLTWPPPDEIAAGDAGGDGVGMGAGGVLPIGYFNPDGDDNVIVGGHNVVFRPHSDWGDSRPTDVGFSAQSVINPAHYGEVQSGPRPRLNLRVFMAEPTYPENPPALNSRLVIDIRRTLIVDSDDPDESVLLSSFFQGFGSGTGDELRLMMRDDALIASDSVPNGAPLDTLIYLTSDQWVCLSEDCYVASDEHSDGAALRDALAIGDSEYLCLQADVWITGGDGEETNFDFKYAEDYSVYAAGTAYLQDT